MEADAFLARTAGLTQTAMSSVSIEAIELFCSRHGVPLPFEISRVRAGRNSEVFMLSGRQAKWILKNYHQHGSDKRERLKTEFGFLEFLNSCGVQGIARPLGMDPIQQIALYSCLSGVRPTAITSDHIGQAAKFVRNINQFGRSGAALQLPLAADACLSWHAHFELTRSRIERLLKVGPESKVEIQAHEFSQTKLLPLSKHLEEKIVAAIKPTGTEVLLTQEERILSPSDFGFHNTLETNGQLAFVDFEYAGWDDPAKLICDFICQPELPVSVDQGWAFMEEFLEYLPYPDAVRARVQHLLPIHRIKWCCILLNEFRVEDRSRRLHAGVDSIDLLAQQLGKARRYFDNHLATIS
jgi:Phosphotransferase enzyme family